MIKILVYDASNHYPTDMWAFKDYCTRSPTYSVPLALGLPPLLRSKSYERQAFESIHNIRGVITVLITHKRRFLELFQKQERSELIKGN